MAVAIRTATRIQDQDDAPSLGAGQQGYALTWNNATGAFVATPLFTGGLLATGATTGATAQAQAFTNGVITGLIKPAADSTSGVLIRNSSADTTVIHVDTTNKNVGIGPNAPTVNLHVARPGITYGLWESTDGGGDYLGFFSSGTFGPALYWKDSKSLRFILSANNTGTSTATEVLRITNDARVGIGTTSPATLLHSRLESVATNAVTNVVTIGHDTSGTAAAGFGAGLAFQLESSTTAAQSAARVQALWYEATHATRKADLVLTAYDTAEREGLRIRGAGSAPAIGFYGVTPIVRAVLATGAGATVDNVITALQNLGLVKQS